MENEIRRAEQSVVLESMKEVMWGGKTTEGLVYVVSQMRESVTDLVKTVKLVSADVNGQDGVRADLRSLRSELTTLKNIEGRIEEKKSREYQSIHDRISNIELIVIRKLEDRVDRIEVSKVNLSVVQDWRDISNRGRDELGKRIDSLESRFEEMRSRGTTTITAWTAIVVSTILSLISLYSVHVGH